MCDSAKNGLVATVNNMFVRWQPETYVNVLTMVVDDYVDGGPKNCPQISGDYHDP